MAKKDPTERQQKVLKNIVEKRGSLRQAMLDAGYSEAYATNPKQFKETASWQQLLDEFLPDWKLTEIHRKLLDSEDENIQVRSVDLGYKIKGKNVPEVTEHIIRNYEDLSDEELEEIYNAKSKRSKKTTDD